MCVCSSPHSSLSTLTLALGLCGDLLSQLDHSPSLFPLTLLPPSITHTPPPSPALLPPPLRPGPSGFPHPGEKSLNHSLLSLRLSKGFLPPLHTLTPSLPSLIGSRRGDGLVIVDLDYCGNAGAVCVCVRALVAPPGQLGVCRLSHQPFRLCCHCYDSMPRQMAATISKQSLLSTHASQVLVRGN